MTIHLADQGTEEKGGGGLSGDLHIHTKHTFSREYSKVYNMFRNYAFRDYMITVQSRTRKTGR